MFFMHKEKEYSVNIKNVFDEIDSNDYVDTLDTFGVIIHSLSDNPEFHGSVVFLMIGNAGKITIEVDDKENDDYYIIDPILTEEERKKVEEYLKFE